MICQEKPERYGMDQIIFYAMEKNNVRLAIAGGTSYENAISTCQEFIGKLQELMAAEIARVELLKKREADLGVAEETYQEKTDGSN